MGIYGAINSAVSGLAAQSTALENISGNVANSQTTGYKRLDTTFSDLVSGGGTVQADQVAGTTYATSRATNQQQGDISANDVDTYLAINGEGYFVVTSAADVVDGNTTFQEVSYYTRAGDFELDEQNYMMNSSGYFLKGFPLDPTTGNAVGDTPGVIQISDAPDPANPTTQINYQANLPRVPQPSAFDPNTADSELLTAAEGFGDDIAIGAATDTFIANTISGGATTAYDANGTPVNVEIRWGKTLNFDAGVPQDNQWALYLSTGDDTVAPSWYEIGTVDFDNTGAVTATAASGGTFGAANVTALAANGGFNIDNLVVDGDTLPAFDFSFTSLTQYSSTSGQVTSLNVNQNGYASGELVGVSVDASGRINATYSNSQTRALYEIPLATFDAEQNLKRVDGAAFEATPTSGEANLTGTSGSIISNALELSNADIASEFSKLIITQQAYSANSRIVTTADQMLDDALNVIR
ncbi:flagellar hook protein FlgE [Roseibium hamelinense]|uniref:Flagellar hook protein FlgE n=1 Tax=Roseibium hamelinense TaxID=150831 RepID=A0A562T9Q5_9HYPH|nr:flagellar hook-basal body complex protein [Roseibium hamelinense]MTI45269.1 flagellar hook-basal body complex protein [Roseibium hamelinense]TWI90369.1 flagellar hook protein FlgE [Roseibium hamelinense]